MKSVLIPKMWQIGIHTETRDQLAKHPIAKDFPVLEHEDHHGGFVLHLTSEQYALLSPHTSADFIRDEARDSRSSIELAVRKAFSV
jgi:hypothetical protein